MFLSTLLLTPFLSAALASTIGDLQALNADYVNLTTDDQEFQRNLISALGIQAAFISVQTQTTLATANADIAPPLNETESQAVVSYVLNTLEPNIAAAIAATEANEASIAAGGATALVEADLVSIQNQTDALGQAVINISPEDQQDATQSAFTKIHNDYNGAIAAFA